MGKRSWACLAVVAALTAHARAADDPTRRGFDADPVRPALSLDPAFAVDTAGTEPAGTWRMGALLQLADGLLTIRGNGARADLLASRLSLHLLAGASLGRLELAAGLPFALRQASDLSPLTSQGVTGPLVDPISRTALGDLRLGAKLALLDAAAAPVGLAALLELRLPTGSKDAFTSDGLALAPSLVATRSFGKVRVDAQAGYLLRDAGQYAQLVVHDAFTYGVAGSVPLPPLSRLRDWRAFAEVTGAIPRGFDAAGARYRAPLSTRAGVRAFLTPRLSVEAGGGAGLGEVGYGHERWRIFAGIRFGGAPAPAVRPGDRDGDGVPDENDRCPDQPGKPELDGCPDRDGDGIPDPQDRCPDQPGPAERDGCPPPEDEPLVELTTSRLSLNDSIHFDTGRDTIKPESFPVLDQIAKLLQDHPELAKVRVEGHTDNVGGAAYNRDLSRRRAASVVRYLVGKGIAADRLASAGYGFDQPIASNDTALGRAKNRRVQFTILARGAAP